MHHDHVREFQWVYSVTCNLFLRFFFSVTSHTASTSHLCCLILWGYAFQHWGVQFQFRDQVQRWSLLPQFACFSWKATKGRGGVEESVGVKQGLVREWSWKKGGGWQMGREGLQKVGRVKGRRMGWGGEGRRRGKEEEGKKARKRVFFWKRLKKV